MMSSCGEKHHKRNFHPIIHLIINALYYQVGLKWLYAHIYLFIIFYFNTLSIRELMHIVLPLKDFNWGSYSTLGYYFLKFLSSLFQKWVWYRLSFFMANLVPLMNILLHFIFPFMKNILKLNAGIENYYV